MAHAAPPFTQHPRLLAQQGWASWIRAMTTYMDGYPGPYVASESGKAIGLVTTTTVPIGGGVQHGGMVGGALQADMQHSKVESGLHGSPRFYALLEELAELHSRKNHDYAATADPLSNLRMAETFGVPAWKGVLVRMSDKWSRITQLVSGKQPKNESLKDSLLDLAVYSLLTIVLLEESPHHDPA